MTSRATRRRIVHPKWDQAASIADGSGSTAAAQHSEMKTNDAVVPDDRGFDFMSLVASDLPEQQAAQTEPIVEPQTPSYDPVYSEALYHLTRRVRAALRAATAAYPTDQVTLITTSGWPALGYVTATRGGRSHSVGVRLEDLMQRPWVRLGLLAARAVLRAVMMVGVTVPTRPGLAPELDALLDESPTLGAPRR